MPGQILVGRVLPTTTAMRGMRSDLVVCGGTVSSVTAILRVEPEAAEVGSGVQRIEETNGLLVVVRSDRVCFVVGEQQGQVVRIASA